MEHLFREREIREMEKATGRPAFTERFKTALYRAQQAQYNMRKKIDKAEVEEIMIYRELAPDGKKIQGLYDVSEKQPECTTYIDAHRDVRVIEKDTGGVDVMIRKFFKWLTSAEDFPGLVLRMFTAILLSWALMFILVWLAYLTILSL